MANTLWSELDEATKLRLAKMNPELLKEYEAEKALAEQLEALRPPTLEEYQAMVERLIILHTRGASVAEIKEELDKGWF